MIHIDDLVRNKLMGAEEETPSGAWLNMRDLLDQKMPIQPVANGRNWRRMFGLISGLVLLTTATIGGYKVVVHQQAVQSTFNDQQAETYVPGASQQIVLSASTSKTVAASNKFSSEASGSNQNHLPQLRAKKLVALNSISASNSNSTTENQSSVLGKKEANTKSKFSNNNATDSKLVGSNVAGQMPVGETKVEHPFIKSIKPKSSETTVASVSKASNATTNTNQKQSFNSGTKTPNLTTALPSNQLSKDTFEQMQIVQRYIINPITRTSRIVTDTISFSKMAVDKHTLCSIAENKEDNTNVLTRIFASRQEMMAEEMKTDAALMKAGIGGNIVSLSNLKTKSRHTKAWDARSFNEVMRDFSFNLTHMKFKPGLLLGYNNLMVDGSLFNGFHFGLTGQLCWDDQWSFMTELKYIHRISNNYSFDDSYVTPAGPNLQKKVQHFFKFSAIQSIELPAAIRYSFNRLDVFGGANFNYMFGLNPDEVEQPNSQPEPVSSNYNQSEPTVFTGSFQNRFCIGGMLGISYAISPSLQLDLRATKNLWDNTSGDASKRISQAIFNGSSFQISVGYKLSGKEKFPKAL